MALRFERGALTANADRLALGARPHIRHVTTIDLTAARFGFTIVCGAPAVSGFADNGAEGGRRWCLCQTPPIVLAVCVVDADRCAFGARPHVLCAVIARIECFLTAARLCCTVIGRAGWACRIRNHGQLFARGRATDVRLQRQIARRQSVNLGALHAAPAMPLRPRATIRPRRVGGPPRSVMTPRQAWGLCLFPRDRFRRLRRPHVSAFLAAPAVPLRPRATIRPRRVGGPSGSVVAPFQAWVLRNKLTFGHNIVGQVRQAELLLHLSRQAFHPR